MTIHQLVGYYNLLFESNLEEKDFWYGLLTGKSLKDLYKQHKKEQEIIEKRRANKGVLEFPDDTPYLPESEIRRMLENNKYVSPDDVYYWDEERVSMARSDEPWKRRIAMSDWYWSWYRQLRRRNLHHLVTRETLIAKRELDELIASICVLDENGEPEFTDEVAIIDSSKLTEEINIKLSELLGKVLHPGYEIKLT